jgi:hypothetical protein
VRLALTLALALARPLARMCTTPASQRDLRAMCR